MANRLLFLKKKKYCTLWIYAISNFGTVYNAWTKALFWFGLSRELLILLRRLVAGLVHLWSAD